MKTKFTFSVLRYVHDLATGEFANVGVALYAPEAKYLSAACTPRYGRLSKMFHDIEGEHYKQMVRFIENRIEEIGERIKSELPFEKLPTAVSQILSSVLPPDDSSLQFSPEGAGVSENLPATLDELFNRYVEKYTEKPIYPSRSDEDIWKVFRKSLEEKRVIASLKPLSVNSQDDEYEFQYAWENSKWHALEPVSFDLVEPYSMIKKAHEWLGRGHSLLSPEILKRALKEGLKLYFLLGGPKDEKLLSYFTKAKNILNKIPCDHDFFTEEDADKLANLVKKDLEQHNKSQS